MTSPLAPRFQFALLVACALVLLPLIFYGCGAWYFSQQMILPVHLPPKYQEKVEDIETTSSGETTISMARTSASGWVGTYGLVWDGGSALLGPVISQTPRLIQRRLLRGSHPMKGAHALMSWTFGPDPKTAYGLDYSEVRVQTELGTAPAWYIPAAKSSKSGSPPDTWVITVHGSNADRRQFLRFVPSLHDSGLSILDITYRNDLGAPRSPDGLMHMGLTEWRDLDASITTAKSMGARHIVLFGASMGGAIVLQYLVHSPNASHVSAVLLDSPMLCVPRMIKYIAVKHRLPLPTVLTQLSIWMTDIRLSEDIRQIDMLRFPPKAHPPTLLLQGTDDEIMPHEAAHELALTARNENWPFEYEEFPGADHGAVWNSDPRRAELLVDTFLKKLNLYGENN